MLLRDYSMVSNGVKMMARHIRAASLRSRGPCTALPRDSFPFTRRPLHSTPSLLSSAASVLDDFDDDEDLRMFVSAHCLDAAVEQPVKKPDRVVEMPTFDPENAPKSLEELQVCLEYEDLLECTKRYEKIIEAARDRMDYGSLKFVQRQVLNWYQPLKDAIQHEQEIFVAGKKRRKSMMTYGHQLCSLKPGTIAAIIAHEALMHCLAFSKPPSNGVTVTTLARILGEHIEAEINVHRAIERRFRDEKSIRCDDEDAYQVQAVHRFIHDKEGSNDELEENYMDPSEWAYTTKHRQHFIDELMGSQKKRKLSARIANRRAQAMFGAQTEWTESNRIQLGAALIKLLLQVATIPGDGGRPENAFSYQKSFRDRKLIGWIVINDSLSKLIKEEELAELHWNGLPARYKPMVVPPDPWVGPDDGAYKRFKVDVMRTHGSIYQKNALMKADFSVAFDGLNALGQVPWVINKTILDVANECWKAGIVIGDLPSLVDFDLPPEPVKPELDSSLFGDSSSRVGMKATTEYVEYRAALARYNRIRQKNMDLRSMRCSATLKLEQAEKFKDFDKIYFPYNMDFRGRVYPIPPNLSTVGSDLCRGMLTFAKSKKLGPRGLFWLKVHLANLAGMDKISFEDRAAYTEQNMDNIRSAVQDPLGDNRWWMDLEDPFQGLATCHEIINAVDSGDPDSYECSLPVHMDGSCNGLQHYAALGRDLVGGKAVNLCDHDLPQDVYSAVMHEVIRLVAEEAEIDVDIDESRNDLTKKEQTAIIRNQSAKLVLGLIDRSVVKRTVMTSVYGVTLMGARDQIREKVEEKLSKKGADLDEMEQQIKHASTFLAKVTMDAMLKLFSGARETMTWLRHCARLISKQNQPVAFISPIGVPVIQPYRQPKSHTVVTLLQTVVLVDRSDYLPVHSARQVSAFPPNYVHSLDSSHMIFTALEMDRRGLAFAAVHDSFWTHACDVDEMNEVLRDTFIELYNQPLLENLKKDWEMRYPNIVFPDLPATGDLDLEEVRSARYFFQ